MKKFLRNLLIFVAILAVLVGAVDGLYLWHRAGEYTTMSSKRNDDVTVKNVPSSIDVCNLGSSHGIYGFNYSVLPEDYTCFNFGQTDQTLSYDYRILQNYRGSLKEGTVVVILVSHFSFFGTDETERADFASKNSRYYRFLDRDYIKEYDLTAAILSKYLPALTEPHPIALFNTLRSPRGGTDLWQDETNAEAAKSHGKARYKNFIESKKDENGQRIVNQNEIDALYDIIAFCRENGFVPVLVTTPLLSEYSAQVHENDPAFYDDFYGIVGEVVQKTGVAYFDYSEDARFCDDYTLFFNTDHLNRTGAGKFTAILYDEVLKNLLP